MVTQRCCSGLLLSTAASTPSSARRRSLGRGSLHAAATDADAARLTATLASSTVGRSFNFECQKQCWFIRRLPGAYQVTADGVEIVAEGPRSKLEAFERWLVKATTDTESFAAESGDGAGPKSVSYGAATGDLEGWTSRGAALDALKSAEGGLPRRPPRAPTSPRTTRTSTTPWPSNDARSTTRPRTPWRRRKEL